MSGTVVDDRRWMPGVEWLVDGDGCWAEDAKTEEAEQRTRGATGSRRWPANGAVVWSTVAQWRGWPAGVVIDGGKRPVTGRVQPDEETGERGGGPSSHRRGDRGLSWRWVVAEEREATIAAPDLRRPTTVAGNLARWGKAKKKKNRGKAELKVFASVLSRKGGPYILQLL